MSGVIIILSSGQSHHGIGYMLVEKGETSAVSYRLCANTVRSRKQLRRNSRTL